MCLHLWWSLYLVGSLFLSFSILCFYFSVLGPVKFIIWLCILAFMFGWLGTHFSHFCWVLVGAIYWTSFTFWGYFNYLLGMSLVLGDFLLLNNLLFCWSGFSGSSFFLVVLLLILLCVWNDGWWLDGSLVHYFLCFGFMFGVIVTIWLLFSLPVILFLCLVG